jgi:hypothetical protein
MMRFSRGMQSGMPDCIFFCALPHHHTGISENTSTGIQDIDVKHQHIQRRLCSDSPIDPRNEFP